MNIKILKTLILVILFSGVVFLKLRDNKSINIKEAVIFQKDDNVKTKMSSSKKIANSALRSSLLQNAGCLTEFWFEVNNTEVPDFIARLRTFVGDQEEGRIKVLLQRVTDPLVSSNSNKSTLRMYESWNTCKSFRTKYENNRELGYFKDYLIFSEVSETLF